MNLTSEMEDLKRELHQAAKKHEDAVSIIRETHQENMKEKDRIIRQIKGERDSLFDELKTLQKNVQNNDGGVISRTLSRNKLLSDQFSPQSIKREPIKHT